MSTPKGDTWMPLYVSDYLKKTRRLSTAQHGAYFLLLLEAWTHNGIIPSDDASLARIVGMSTREWRAAKPVLLGFWDVCEGGFTQDRVQKELARAKELIEQRSRAGKASAEARERQRTFNERSTSVATETPTEPLRKSRPSPSPSLTTFENNAREPRLLGEDVDRIWDRAPARARERSSRKDVERTLAAAIKRGGDAETITTALVAYWQSEDASKDGGAFAKGIHRMIEGDRWRDWSQASRPAQPADEPENWPWRMEQWRTTGMWLGSWGPTPKERKCRVPAEFLEVAG